MTGQTPADTMRQLFAAFEARDVHRAMPLYLSDATFVAEPGKPASGHDAIRAAHTAFLASDPKLTIEAHEAIESGDVALFCTRWSLNMTRPDGSAVNAKGRGAVVLRRQPDGVWLIAVENPWTEAVGSADPTPRQPRQP